MVTLIVSPASARIFDLREQAIYTEAFEEFVTKYSRGHNLYKKLGPQAFVDSMLPEAVESEKAFVKKVLSTLPKLPIVTSDSALLIVDASNLGAGVHTIEVSNIDDGMLIVDGTPIEIDPAKKDIEYLTKTIEAALDRTTVKSVSLREKFDNLLFPTAHASLGKAALWTVLGMTGAVAINWVWGKWKNRNTDGTSTMADGTASGTGHN